MGSETSKHGPPPDYVCSQSTEYYVNEQGAHNLIELICASHDPSKTHVRARLVHFFRVTTLSDSTMTIEARDVFATHTLALTIAYKHLTQCLSAPEDMRTSVQLILDAIEGLFCTCVPGYQSGSIAYAAMNLVDGEFFVK